MQKKNDGDKNVCYRMKLEKSFLPENIFLKNWNSTPTQNFCEISKLQ